jgi:Right handed beta helix region
MRKSSMPISGISVSKPNTAFLAPVLALLGLFSSQASTLAQGSLTPPGAPAATMKTLGQVEPRIPISTVPINISSPGSYYLTTNLFGATNTSGITIFSGNVTLDLSGFVLKGGGGSSLYDGINIGSTYTNITIRNGTVTGWGGAGLNGMGSVTKNILVENLKVSENGNGGICLSSGVVRDCVSIRNGGTGFVSSQGVVIENCTSEGNSFGFNLGMGSLVQSCRAYNNNASGFTLGINSRVINSAASGNNSGTGISLGGGSTADGCTVVSNSYGIYAGQASMVLNCIVRSNQVCGIQADASTRLLNNLVEGTGGPGATAGIQLISTNSVVDGCQVINNVVPGIMANNGVVVSGNLIIRNQLRGNTSAYNVSTTNIMGPIISTASGVSAGIITNSNPWANFSY